MAENKTRELLAQCSQLSPLQSAAVASILGAAVADAAARPLHWIYDQADLEKLFQENRVPEFWPESKSPFYSLPTGYRSCYNHVLMAGLEAFTEANGEVDLDVYKHVLRKLIVLLRGRHGESQFQALGCMEQLSTSWKMEMGTRTIQRWMPSC